jgi:hypothetical protein
MKQAEHAIQSAIVEWARLSQGKQPALKSLFAIPNGGKRNAITGAILKSEGVRAGMPDLCLCVSRGGYNALFIEVKTPIGRLSAAQKNQIADLEANGSKCVTVRSPIEAISAINDYLKPQILSGSYRPTAISDAIGAR